MGQGPRKPILEKVWSWGFKTSHIYGLDIRACKPEQLLSIQKQNKPNEIEQRRTPTPPVTLSTMLLMRIPEMVAW